MLRNLTASSVRLFRTRFPAYFAESASRASSTSEATGAESKKEDEPFWEMENPYKKTRRQCVLCQHDIKVDYKNVQLLSQFVSNLTGQLYDKHITGLCHQQQRRVRIALSRAQTCGLMPIYHKDMRFLRDPKLFDPMHPQRPNPH